MLKDVPISPRLQSIHTHYEIAPTTCEPSSWSLQHRHQLILTFRVSLAIFTVWNKISCQCVVRDPRFTAQFKTPVNRTLQPTDCTEKVETCHTLLLRFEVPLPVLKVPVFPLDRTRQQHSPQFLITPRTHLYTYIYTHIRTYTHTYTYTYIRTYIHTYIHT